MDLGRKTGSASYEIELVEPISGLFIALASGANIFTTETIRVSIKGRNRDVEIIPTMTILKAIELFENDEIVLKTLAGEAQAVIPFNPAMDEIGCDIAPNGAERIVIELGSMIAGSNYDIYGIETETNVRSCYQIDEKSVLNATKQKYNIEGYDQVVLPMTNLTEVKFTYKSNGRTITRSKAEMLFEQTINGEVKQIRGIALSGNAETLDISSMFEPAERLAIDLTKFSEIEVSATNGYTFECIKTQTY